MVFRLPTTLNTTQLDTLAFLNGLNADDSLSTINFFNWNQDIPATYGPASNPDGVAHKWQAELTTRAVAGTSGGTVDVYFDPGSNWTTAEKTSFISGLTLWSDYANISFTVVTNSAQANFTFYRYTTTTPPAGGLSDGAYTSYGYSQPGGPPAMGNVTGGYMSIDTNLYGFQDLDSFSEEGGYGIDTIVHEEGHLLGLGHAGPYNGNVNPATQQFSVYDTRLYSIMSYIQPNDSSARYYSSYPVSGANWGTTSDGGERAPYTPQMLDILAVQQLYGVSTSTTFAGGQIFGFNCNITDAARPFFDFTVDTKPVITIWDSGTNNTLDLSGFSTASTVDLNPGDFSSVAGLVDNIGIAYSTKIDSAIGGPGNDTFKVNADADVIDGGGGTNTVIFASPRADYTIDRLPTDVTVEDTLTSVTDTLTQIQFVQFTDMTVPVCYLKGTRIRSVRGDVPIEDLVIGDELVTCSGAVRTLQWVGRRSYDGRFAAANPLVRPIVIAAHAFEHGVPARDLYVSPAHAMYLDGVLIPAGALVNGTTIRQSDQAGEVVYFHLEFDAHDVILAEGAWAESYVDCGNRNVFHNAADHSGRDSDQTRFRAVEYAPRSESGCLVDAVRARLIARAAMLGHRRPKTYSIRLDRAGPVCVSLPAGVTEVQLHSHAGRAAGDYRALGALLSSITLGDQALALTDKRLVRGFHRVEQHGETLVRWTNGEAVISLEPAEVEQLLEVTVSRLVQAQAA